MTTTEPYRLARVYQRLVSGVLPYDQVAAAYARLLRRFDSGVGTVLDVACGAGNLTIPLARHGFDITGLDASPEMLEAARRKASSAGLAIPFECRDIRDAGRGSPVDAVVCFYGGLNYLTSPDDLRVAFAALHARLRPGGLFVFDQFSETRMRRLFSGTSRLVRGGSIITVRSRCLADGRIAHRLTVERDGVRHVERHRLRIHPFSEIVRLLGDVGFAVVHRDELSRELGGCLDLADDHIFVARRP